MSNNIMEDHRFLTDFIEKFQISPETEFELSKYLPGSKGKTSFRDIFKYKVRDYNDCKLNNFKDISFEVALHSKFKFNGRIFHIPMVDFNVVSEIEMISNKLKILKVIDSPLYIYNSGRSFHGYYLNLLTETEWYKYLGALLLLNDRKKPFKYIDSRWIGHSLEHGYSALRLTKNTDNYLNAPKFIEII